MNLTTKGKPPKIERVFKQVSCAQCNSTYTPTGPGAKFCKSCTPFKSGPKKYQYRYQRAWKARMKEMILDHYGRACVCCGESEPRFLTLDHINGGGSADRRKNGGGAVFYRKVIDWGYPDTLQILCWNCNLGKHHNGGICPHQEALVNANNANAA